MYAVAEILSVRCALLFLRSSVDKRRMIVPFVGTDLMEETRLLVLGQSGDSITFPGIGVFNNQPQTLKDIGFVKVGLYRHYDGFDSFSTKTKLGHFTCSKRIGYVRNSLLTQNILMMIYICLVSFDSYEVF